MQETITELQRKIKKLEQEKKEMEQTLIKYESMLNQRELQAEIISQYNKKQENKGMKKLVDLLNHYDKISDLMYSREIEGDDIQGYNHFRGGYEMINVGECIIISKRYGFIERLVGKNLVDLYKIPEIKEANPDYIEGKSDILLMFLAISHDPISDLISYLK